MRWFSLPRILVFSLALQPHLHLKMRRIPPIMHIYWMFGVEKCVLTDVSYGSKRIPHPNRDIQTLETLHLRHTRMISSNIEEQIVWTVVFQSGSRFIFHPCCSFAALCTVLQPRLFYASKIILSCLSENFGVVKVLSQNAASDHAYNADGVITSRFRTFWNAGWFPISNDSLNLGEF